MDSVLVTGGTGFVGFWLKQTEPDSVNCWYIGKDNYESAPWGFHSWDCIVHLANIAPKKVLTYCRLNNARLLYCSSGIVYHPENDTEYRRNKIKWEQECLDSGADVVICRLFAFHGERLSADKAIVAFENAAKKDEPLIIYGDGKTVRTYMSGEDMARRMWAVLLHGERGGCYDIGGTTPITMIELAKKIIKDNNSKSEIIIEGGKDPMPYYVPVDAEKTERLLDMI